MLLKASDDFEEVGGGWVAFGAEHLMQCLGVDAGLLGQRGKAHGRIDEIAQNLSAQRALACQQRINGVTQQAAAKLLVTAHPRLYRLSKIPRQRHGSLLFCNLYSCQHATASAMSSCCRCLVPPQSRMTIRSPSFPK